MKIYMLHKQVFFFFHSGSLKKYFLFRNWVHTTCHAHLRCFVFIYAILLLFDCMFVVLILVYLMLWFITYYVFKADHMSPLSCRQEREASFAQKKAERATVRSHFREKYRLPKVNFQAVLYSTCCMFGLPHRDTLACKHVHSTGRKRNIDSLHSVF